MFVRSTANFASYFYKQRSNVFQEHCSVSSHAILSKASKAPLMFAPDAGDPSDHRASEKGSDARRHSRFLAEMVPS